jgi:hypothetical protein
MMWLPTDIIIKLFVQHETVLFTSLTLLLILNNAREFFGTRTFHSLKNLSSLFDASLKMKIHIIQLQLVCVYMCIVEIT